MAQQNWTDTFSRYPLADLRNTLLPKLLSRELSVVGASDTVEALQ